MNDSTSAGSGADRIGSKKQALFVVLSPALLVAGRYVTEAHIQHYYRFLLDPHNFFGLLPVFGMCGLYWFFALLRLVWPERMPGLLAYDSSHIQKTKRLRKRMFWASFGCFVGMFAFGIFFGGGILSLVTVPTRFGTPMIHAFFIACIACMTVGFTLSSYIQYRTR
jgi:hypothetical protein